MTSICAHFWVALAVWKAVHSHEAVHVFFFFVLVLFCLSNFKVVLIRMLCPYQFHDGNSPVFCDVNNAKSGKNAPESSAKLL